MQTVVEKDQLHPKVLDFNFQGNNVLSKGYAQGYGIDIISDKTQYQDNLANFYPVLESKSKFYKDFMLQTMS